MNRKRKIVVALSGGIDSAFSAHLVKKEFPDDEITAVFMQNWDDFVAGNQVVKSKCTQTEDWEDAQKVASFLGIGLQRRQFINEYWEEVFTDFLAKLKSGITPNPDVLCNSLVKFSHFVNYVKHELNANYLVTGHYARIVYDQKSENYYLAKCKDENKDQTYFLCQVNRSVLPFLIFPLSEFKKQEVKQQTLKMGFPNTQRKESTGICFIGESNFRKFISNYLPEDPGGFVDAETKLVVGRQRGTSFYTIGQRRGLALGGEKTPYYVVGKDIGKKIVYVAKRSDN